MNRKMMTLGSGLGALALLTGLATVHGSGPARPNPQGAPISTQSTTIARRAVPRRVPRIRGRTGNSTNWSGYAVAGPNVSNVTDVVGSWTVPAVGPSGCSSTYSAAWVGIDGDTDNTVEQLGTEQDYINGQPSYYAWFEMYPHFSYYITAPGDGRVAPGDTITAEVKYAGGGRFTLSMKSSRGLNFSTTQKLNSAQRLSAEWIMEAPWSGGVLPLAAFGTIGFNGCYATATTAGSSSQKSLGDWIGLGSNYYDQIDMVDSNNAIKALTNSASATSFSIDWKNCQ